MNKVNVEIGDNSSIQMIKEAKEAGLTAKMNSDEESIAISGNKQQLIEFLNATEETFPSLFETVAKKTFGQYLIENSTDDAKKSLDAIIGFLKDQDDLDASGKEMLKFGEGIMDYFKKEGGFSPKQASWIFQSSKALFK